MLQVFLERAKSSIVAILFQFICPKGDSESTPHKPNWRMLKVSFKKPKQNPNRNVNSMCM